MNSTCALCCKYGDTKNDYNNNVFSSTESDIRQVITSLHLFTNSVPCCEEKYKELQERYRGPNLVYGVM